MSGQTEISVVVNSYLRTETVFKALESVIMQRTLASYEVILVTASTSFAVPDRLLQEAGKRGVDIKLVKVGQVPVGAGLMKGIKSSSGKVICLLDDDDLWEPAKIEAVRDAFARSPKVGFFHNGQTLFDELGHPLPPWNLHRLVRHPSTREPEGRSFAIEPTDKKLPHFVKRYELMFNNSSISIVRDAIRPWESQFERVRGGEDNFLLYAALQAGVRIVGTTDRLSRVRIHSRGTTAGGTGPEFSYAGGLAEYRTLIDRHIAERELAWVLVQKGKESAAEPQVRHDRALTRILSRVVIGLESGVAVKEELREILREENLPLSAGEVALIALGLGSLCSEQLTRAALLTWRLTW